MTTSIFEDDKITAVENALALAKSQNVALREAWKIFCEKSGHEESFSESTLEPHIGTDENFIEK